MDDRSKRMTVQAQWHKGEKVYNEFYSRGGWKYSFWKEYLWHRKHFVKRFGLRRGMQILEVACGNGFHTHLFNRMGFPCLGVDRSSAAIEWAQSHYPECTYHCLDLMGELPMPERGFDVVFARGCSNYHYDLESEQSLATTRHLMNFVTPGGIFVMMIVSDLSGDRPPEKIWQNRLEDYQKHFAQFGKASRVEWVPKEKMVICALWQPAQ